MSDGPTGTAGVPAACGQDARGPIALDRRLNAYRADLADEQLRGRLTAARYVAGQPARVVTGRAPVTAKPIPSAETITFYHYGEELRVFDTADGFAWCQSLFDSYVGYVDARYVALGSSPAPTHYAATTGCYAYRNPDLRSPQADFLPRHGAVAVVETGLLTRGTEYARLDTGLHVPLACLSPEPPRSPDIVAGAELYLGCPYLWGGRSFVGIDCSGLVQSAFRDLGVTVLRDTDMQRDTIGEKARARRESELRRGDLIYLPGHVMIYAGEGEVIHADGATMTVRRDNLAALMQARGLDFAGFVVRRP
jgi:cell wall-associated NlpC family hydrolase